MLQLQSHGSLPQAGWDLQEILFKRILNLFKTCS